MNAVGQTARDAQFLLVRRIERNCTQLLAATFLLACAAISQAGGAGHASLRILDSRPWQTFSSLPVSITIAVNGEVDVSTLRVKLNGVDVTSRFALQGSRLVGSLSIADGIRAGSPHAGDFRSRWIAFGQSSNLLVASIQRSGRGPAWTRILYDSFAFLVQPTAPAQFTVGGTVSGLSGSGLILVNNEEQLRLSTDGAFTFPTTLAPGATYSAVIAGQPAQPSQTCSISNASGTIQQSNVSNLQVQCITNAYSVGGVVKGLGTSGLTLRDASGGSIEIAGNGTFNLPVNIASGESYDVFVATQPPVPAQFCEVQNGSGIVDASPIDNVEVTCSIDSFRGLSKYEFDSDGPVDEIARLGYVDDSSVAIHGEVDEQGLPVSVSRFSYRVSETDGAFANGTAFLSEEGLPQRLLFEDGSSLSLDWSIPGKLSFVYENRAKQQRVASEIPLPTENPEPASSLDSVFRSARRASSSRDSTLMLAEESAIAEATAKTVTLALARCGVPVTDADVEISFRPSNSAQYPSKAIASHVGDGIYQSTFNTSKMLPLPSVACRVIEKYLSRGCTIAGPTRGNEFGVCLAISAAIDAAIPVPAGEGVLIFPKCLAGLKVYNTYCAVHKGPVSGADGISAADFVCNAIAEVESVLPSPSDQLYQWSAFASAGGVTRQSENVSAAYGADVDLGELDMAPEGPASCGQTIKVFSVNPSQYGGSGVTLTITGQTTQTRYSSTGQIISTDTFSSGGVTLQGFGTYALNPTNAGKRVCLVESGGNKTWIPKSWTQTDATANGGYVSYTSSMSPTGTLTERREALESRYPAENASFHTRLNTQVGSWYFDENGMFSRFAGRGEILVNGDERFTNGQRLISEGLYQGNASVDYPAPIGGLGLVRTVTGPAIPTECN